MATTTNPNADMDELKKVFNKFDANGDGKISFTELVDVLKALGSGSSTDDDVKKMMDEIDTDRDGFISLDEFADFWSKGSATAFGSGAASAELKEAFELYDQDKNGLISAAELHQILSRLGEKCSVEDCGRMIKSVDSDGDGLKQELCCTYSSCCVIVQNMQRCVYAIPNGSLFQHDIIMKLEKDVEESLISSTCFHTKLQEMASGLKIEIAKQLLDSNVSSFSMAPVKRSYAFERPDIPIGENYVLKINYPFRDPPLPSDLKGELFSALLGTHNRYCWLGGHDISFIFVGEELWCRW